jgi:hypothetical protein
MTDAYFFVKNIKAKDQNLIEIDLYEEWKYDCRGDT